jgi:hypothetical protein
MLLPRALTARREEYVFRVPPPLVISGRVIDAETKQSIKQFRVVKKYRFGKGQNTQGGGDSFPARDGQFRMRETLEQFAHVVRIEADGYLPVESRDIKSDEGTVSIDFALSRSIDLFASVFTADGSPAAEAKVAFGVAGETILLINGDIQDDKASHSRWITDSTGQFHFPPLVDEFWLMVTHPSGFARLKCAPKSMLKSIRLTPWARVEGTYRVGRKLEPNALILIQHSSANALIAQEGAPFDY